MTKSDLALVRHEFAWSRRLEVDFGDAPAGMPMIQQTQSFKGSMEYRP